MVTSQQTALQWYNYRAAMCCQFTKAIADSRVYLPEDDEVA